MSGPATTLNRDSQAAETTRAACRRTLHELAYSDPAVICVDADTGGLEDVFAGLPGQYVNTGIAEANMISVAAGLAATGLRPFAHTIAGFAAARACEQIKIDVAGSSLPVCVVVTHAGLSAGHYGPTHHAVDDLAILRAMPNMTILVPADSLEAECALRAAYRIRGPVYLRLGRSPTPPVHRHPPEFTVGQALRLRDGDDVTLIATGPYPVHLALAAADDLARHGLSARVLNMHTVKPLDEDAISRAAAQTAGIVTVEDHLVTGGLGGAVCEVVTARTPCPVRRVGVRDAFSERVGDERHLLAEAGVTADAIVSAARHVTRGAARRAAG